MSQRPDHANLLNRSDESLSKLQAGSRTKNHQPALHFFFRLFPSKTLQKNYWEREHKKVFMQSTPRYCSENFFISMTAFRTKPKMGKRVQAELSFRISETERPGAVSARAHTSGPFRNRAEQERVAKRNDPRGETWKRQAEQSTPRAVSTFV